MGRGDGRRPGCRVVDTSRPRAIESSGEPSELTDEHDEHDDAQHLPSPSLWPIGFAIGIACLLVGLIVSVAALVIGALLAVLFGFLWVRDLTRSHGPVESAEPGLDEQAGAEEWHAPAYDRSGFLTAATIGVSGMIGALVTVPVLGFAVLPSFESSDEPEVDLGPLKNFPKGKFVIATFTERP